MSEEREKIVGVNLGNWLVLEKWMQPFLFEENCAEDEVWLNRKVPAKKLHSELKDQGGPVLVVFTWEDCPTCTALQIYFDKHKEKYQFQILFAPIAGNALRYLDKQTAPRNEQKELLAGVSVTSQILADHTGALRVPAFAWRVENRDLPSGAEVGCATLSGQELDHLLARMAAAVDQGSSK